MSRTLGMMEPASPRGGGADSEPDTILDIGVSNALVANVQLEAEDEVLVF